MPYILFMHMMIREQCNMAAFIKLHLIHAPMIDVPLKIKHQLYVDDDESATAEKMKEKKS